MTPQTMTMTNSTSLTLYNLSGDLLDLLAVQAEMVENEENTEAIDQQIAVYMQALPDKVDAVAHVANHYRWLESAAEQEEKRLKARKHYFQRTRERLLRYVAAVLERLPKPKMGSTRTLQGQTSALSLVQNGGQLELDVYDSTLVPNDLCTYVVEFEHNEYLQALELMGTQSLKRAERIVDNKAVRQQLQTMCWECGGGDNQANCPSCGGTGKMHVSGARLLDRGFRVVIK